MVLCVGAKGVGKTLLLKKLSGEEGSADSAPDLRQVCCIPTVGVSHYQVQLPTAAGSRKGRRRRIRDTVEVRELGGALAQNWPSYFRPDDRTLIFVVDPNDASAIPEVAVHLLRCLEVLAARVGEGKGSVLLLYSKSDLAGSDEELRTKIERLRLLLRLPEVTCWHQENIEFEELSCSVWKDEGFPVLKDWIRRKTAQS